MTITTQVLPLDGDVPQIAYRWNSKTEILAARVSQRSNSRDSSRTIELAGSLGSYVSLDLVDDVLAGIEVVVWPQGDIVNGLDLPVAARRGQLRVIPMGSTTDPVVIELGGPLSCTRTADQSTVHLFLGRPKRVEVIRLADNLLAEVDEGGQLTGFWLHNVPPFPEVKETD